VVHDAVDAEIQVGAIKLEQFAQKLLEFFLVPVYGRHSFISGLPGIDVHTDSGD
jgi:hypothetical protein